MVLSVLLLPTALVLLHGGRCPAPSPSLASRPSAPSMMAEPRVPIQYIRDLDDDECDIDDTDCITVDGALVQALVDERSVARAERDYVAADALKTKITEMGVKLVDTPGREAWYVTARRERGLSAEEVEDVVADVVSEYESAKARFAMAARGHDYTRVGGAARGIAGQISLGRIDEILKARLAAKAERDFAKADVLLAELAAIGIAVNDDKRRWRADGKGFAAEYRRVVGDGDESGADLDAAAVGILLADRAVAKTKADYAMSDALAATLRSTHDVIVDDRRRTWRVVRQSGGYYRVGPSVGKAQARIEGLVAKRAARVRRAGEADAEGAACLVKLHLLGVALDDEAMTWSRPRRTAEQKAVQAKREAQAARARRRGEKPPSPRSRGRSRSRPQQGAAKSPKAAEAAKAAVEATGGAGKAAGRGAATKSAAPAAPPPLVGV